MTHATDIARVTTGGWTGACRCGWMLSHDARWVVIENVKTHLTENGLCCCPHYVNGDMAMRLVADPMCPLHPED